MGTRSIIAIQNSPGHFRSIYCHWDGYPEHNGKILVENYIDPVKINQLMDEGDLSSLAPEIGEAHAFNEHPEGQCTFYARDRGETAVKARKHGYVSFVVDELDKYGAEYVYLFIDGDWYFCEGPNQASRRVRDYLKIKD